MLDVPATQVDMDLLRRRFSELFDEAALTVHRAGLDLDDVIMERFLLCRIPSRTDLRVRVHHLASADEFVRDLQDQVCSFCTHPVALAEIHLTGLEVDVIHEGGPQTHVAL